MNGLTVEREVRIPTLLERDSIQLKTVIKEQIAYHGVKNIVIDNNIIIINILIQGKPRL